MKKTIVNLLKKERNKIQTLIKYLNIHLKKIKQKVLKSTRCYNRLQFQLQLQEDQTELDLFLQLLKLRKLD